MMGVAAGLLTGFKPFTHTFAPFMIKEYLISYFYPVHMQEIQSMFMAQIQDLVWHPMVELIQRGKITIREILSAIQQMMYKWNGSSKSF